MCLNPWKNFAEIRTVWPMAETEFSRRLPKRNTTATSLLAANVRRLRLAKKMTQDDLAAAVDIEQREISLIENERANPAVLLLDALANALDVQIAELFDARARPLR